MQLPEYDSFIIEMMCNTLRSWLDKRRHNVVWLHKMDIDQLEQWARDLAEKYRTHEFQEQAERSEPLVQPNDGWTPAEPWPH